MDDPGRRSDETGPPATDRDDSARGAAADRPHARIAQLMAVVALVALDLAVYRWLQAHYWFRTGPLGSHLMAVVLIAGAWPMANFLALALLVGRRGRCDRPFLMGFEASGAVALALCIAASRLFPRESVMFCIQLAQGGLGAGHPIDHYWVTAGVLAPAQLAVALVGGLVAHRLGLGGRRERDRSRGGPGVPPLPSREP